MAERNRVLVVDDNVAVRTFISSVLVPMGYRVDTAEDGVVALARVTREPVDLILLDLIMPRMTGYHLCMALEQKKLLPGVPVVLLSSARDQVVERVRKETSRLTDFLPKPVTVQALKDLVKKHLPLPAAAPSVKVGQGAQQGTITVEVEEQDSDGGANLPTGLRSILRDRLENALLDALFPQLEKLAAAQDPKLELMLVTGVLEKALSDKLLDNLIGLVRGKPAQDPP